jgi:probable F420-dependent oxidoreductase
MAHQRPFRFGVQASRAATGRDWLELARRTEALGYSALLMPDHFGDQLAPVPALAAAAACTTTLRIGALVFDNDYRHPVVLAKEAATLDLLSEGRLELGLGAGWLATDYQQSGIPYDEPRVRIDRMVEGLAVLKGLLAGGRFSYTGSHYTIAEVEGCPRPVQQPHPPILIGGGGKRILSIAAREANTVGVTANARLGYIGPHTARDVTAAAFDQKLAWVREAAGPRFDDLELQVGNFLFRLTDDPEGIGQRAAQAMAMDYEEVRDTPLVLLGSEEQIVELLLQRRERYGFSFVTVSGDVVEEFAPIVARLAGK